MASIALALPADRARPRAIAAWLLAVAVLVFAMVVVGGITRLTESGLSMVRWEPVSGIVPPIGQAQWQAEFAAYQASPQYAKVNAGMTLSAFQGIYFWEYVHRVLARGIGLVFALPLLWFALRRAIPAGYGWRLTGILGLGALQGGIGWWMVASGLVDRPSVAHERLAVHLVMALIIMSACIWTALDLREGRSRVAAWVLPFLGLLAVQITWGAFTAGLRAGHAANTWPLMLGSWVPPLASLLDDPVSVQWVHRSLAWVVAASALAVAWRSRTAGHRAGLVAALVLVQFSLGVLTIIHGVPIALAAAHQAGAALLLAATLWLAHHPATRR
jgi:cytochrome c oxidase assembly protein subunit 15